VLVESILETIERAPAELKAEGDRLRAAIERIVEVTYALWASGDPRVALANATLYADSIGHVVVAWMWLEQLIAVAGRSGEFSDGAPAGAQRFLLAAIAAFAERGFHGTTTRDIAQLAGSSPAGMYTYYATKLDVLFDVSLTVHEYVLGVMSRGLASGTDPASR